MINLFSCIFLFIKQCYISCIYVKFSRHEHFLNVTYNVPYGLRFSLIIKSNSTNNQSLKTCEMYGYLVCRQIINLILKDLKL